jgi:hypothetical protein
MLLISRTNSRQRSSHEVQYGPYCTLRGLLSSRYADIDVSKKKTAIFRLDEDSTPLPYYTVASPEHCDMNLYCRKHFTFMEQCPFRDANSSSANQEVKKDFVDSERSLPCPNELATGSYPEPDESSPRP